LLISVIIPVFNRPAAATRAVRSVEAQRGLESDEIEIIVVDDASTAPLQRSGLGPNVKLVRLDKNGGPSAARNAGIVAARGDAIAFLDSDDVWLPGKLAQQISAWCEMGQHSPDAPLQALVSGFYYPDRATGRLQARRPRPGQSINDFASGCWFSPGSALLIGRAAFDRIGLFDVRLRRLEDLDWFIRFGLAGGQLHVASHDGVVIAPSGAASFETVKAASDIIAAKFSEGPAVLPASALRRLKAYLALEQGAALLQQGRRVRALRYLLASFAYKPRVRAALEHFWQRSDNVPRNVADIFDELCRHAS
jgi:glycosyltransferase involved in cell wall biosynthesis